MPLLFTIGVSGAAGPVVGPERARKLLRMNGAVSTTHVKDYWGNSVDTAVQGVIPGAIDPNGSAADRITECLNVDMKQPRFRDLWLEDVREAPRKRSK